MSIHCLICGCPSNWRKSGEVHVDNETWVVIKIFGDTFLDVENPTKQRAIEEWWVHRDCLQKVLEGYGVETKLNYIPKEVKPANSPENGVSVARFL